MYLTNLTLRGFKSFASATTMRLEPGITCVVGPNGSGKSNIVDALTWVMGEQGAKSLRGGSMQDVIFAGTSSRPPLGRAEVSLTIDNSDGLLPIEYAEVTISRTLFRNGGSEYAINGESCRLLDIQELLSDTGMGREMHVVVGQGRLDAVLQATAEDRRSFIEEAAGVLKHRRRKDRALRKLDAMAANLARLTDLTGEIRRQLGPLARQADVARRAKAVQVDVRDARARLMADDLAQLRAAAESTGDDEAKIKARLREAESEEDNIRRSLASMEAAGAAAAPRLGEATDLWYRLSAVRERLRGLASVASERASLLGSDDNDDADHGGPAPEELDTRAESAEQAHADIVVEVEAAQQALEDATSIRTNAEEAERSAEHTLAKLHRGVADRREGLARLTGEVAERRSRLEAARGERDRTRERIAESQRRREDAEEKFASLEQSVVGVEEGEAGLDDAYEAATSALDEARANLDQLNADLAQTHAERDTAAARVEALAMTLRHDATDTLRTDIAHITGTVPESLKITTGWEDAIAAALGPWATAALANNVDDAVIALTYARQHDLGQVRILITGADTKSDGGPPTAEAADLPDGVITATSVLSGDPAVVSAARALLPGVVLTTDVEDARQAVGDNPDLTAVTADGDVISAATIAGGTHAPSVLNVQAEHEAATTEVRDATQRAEALSFQIKTATTAVTEAETSAASALDALHASDAELAAVTEELGRLSSLIREANAEAERAGPALDQLEATIEQHHQSLSELTQRLEAAGQQPEQAQEDLTRAETERDNAQISARQARSDETDARLALRTLEERATGLASRVSSLRAAAETERKARAEASRRAEVRRRQADIATAVRQRAEAGARQADVAVERAADERAGLEDERTQRDEATTAMRTELATIGQTLTGLRDAAHRDEVLRAEQRVRLDQAEQRVVEELGMNPDDLIAEYGPHIDVPDSEDPDVSRPYVRAEQEKRLSKAEKDLQRLGKVNPLALEEHAALEERHRFLNDQLQDLKSSRDDLLGIVKDIDDRVQAVFTDAFHDTAREFNQVFSRLFPGGEGKLVLTDPSDMLTTGIEIEARPAGKKIKRLSLLSGGERSLTAVAFLIAIFRARPSPFYVLDEVEAALDDVNLGRLLDIFRELQDTSQLIVITHQKRTMEIADTLYGVAMRGDGVTTLVSQRLAEVS